MTGGVPILIARRIRGLGIPAVSTAGEIGMVGVLLALLTCILLASCSTSVQKLSETVVDSIPHWMGGLPENAPPRPGTPEYADYQRKQEAERARDKSHDPPREPCGRPMPDKTNHACSMNASDKEQLPSTERVPEPSESSRSPQ